VIVQLDERDADELLNDIFDNPICSALAAPAGRVCSYCALRNGQECSEMQSPDVYRPAFE
jgi:hypothetical protein